MQVVIEIPDWEDNDGLLHELRMLQASHEQVINDPLFDEDDLGDETLVIKTDTISLDVARVVGVLADGGYPGCIAVIPLEG